MSQRASAILPLLILAILCQVVVRADEAAIPATTAPTLTTVAEMRALPGIAFDLNHPLALTGVVTLADADRNLLVLQDSTGAVALHPDPPGMPVAAGQRVNLKASACSPYLQTFPAFPDHPSERDVRPTFEGPDNEGNFLLTRMRGWLRPPATGYYTLWIASDDSSDLWLSTSASPEEIRKVAFVPPGQWTSKREWSRFPSQRSERVLLHEGEAYYIEALHEQQTAASYLAVAWEGPGIQQMVIDGQFLTPWSTPMDTPPGHGVLRECWTGYAAGGVTALTRTVAGQTDFAVRGGEISRLDGDVWPEPRRIAIGERLAPDDRYKWVEGEGEVSFMASDGTSASLELATGQDRLAIHVARWHGKLPPLKPRLHVKFRGVCEGENQNSGELAVGMITVPLEKDVSFIEEADAGPGHAGTNTPALVPDEPSLGGYYFTRGVVTFNDRVLGKDRLFVQDGLAGIYISQQDRRLNPLLRVGQFVEVGGHLLPGRYAPGILPLSINIVGAQNLPFPAVPPTETPATDYREGQWTQIEGVARAVNADGTMLLMGKKFPFTIWVGQNGREGLDRLINSTLSVRGVISLDTFDGPVLLVPSRNFLAVVEPAPEPPARPVPVGSLAQAGANGGWVHQTRLAGIVTYRNNRCFFLQDPSGSVRVQPRSEPPTRVGGTVEANGFPTMEGNQAELTEADWHPLDPSPAIVPETLTAQNFEQTRTGALVTTEARLLSQKQRGSEQGLELQTDQHVFEAVLDTADGILPAFAPGSTLELTGVYQLEPNLTVLTRPSNLDGRTVMPTRLLLRTAQDVRLRQGPPWWTWKRAVVFVSALLVVLAASLLRIQYQNRRFARQQTDRLAFAREMLQNQENERRRIAASLHDSLGQDLLVIRNQAHMAIQAIGDAPVLQQRLEGISNTTLQALNEVREITHNLRPYQLDRLGLSQAIRAITRTVSENGSVSFACHVDDIDGVLDNESEIHIYRIVQEGLNNIVKHSGATEAAVVIKKTGGDISISIRDNGRGLVVSGPSSVAGFGLSGIRERAGIMGGAAKLDSAPGQGVNLQVDLPILSETPCVNP